MAVAVKTSPGSQSTGSTISPTIVSLLGVVYLVVCLGILFKLLPDLWWSIWSTMGLDRYRFIGGTLLLTISLAVGVGLLLTGSRLLGPKPAVGIRAGVFLGFVGVLLVLLLTRWVSLWVEYYAYTVGAFDKTTGIIVTSVLGLVILAGTLYLFTRPWMHEFAVMLEEQGWFSATAYKSNQGLRVRRGTIFGILVLVGAGVYTLVSSGTLARGDSDWVLNIPFTGKTAIEYFGDAKTFIAKDVALKDKNLVRIQYPGASGFRVNQLVDFQTYVDTVESIAAKVEIEGAYKAAIPDAAKMNPSDYLLALDKDVVGKRLQTLFAERKFDAGTLRRVKAIYDQSTWEDIGDVLVAFKREQSAMPGKSDEKPKLGGEFDLPLGLMVMDRYTLRDVNASTDESANVKIRVPGASGFKYGQIVPRADFDAKVADLKKEEGATLPVRMNLEPAYGKTFYTGITLLPAVQFTLPLLLLAGSMWIGWRIVNLPAFADFLIATEAELNKVSWTKQKQLVQDTIVVLVTVFMMSVFLFAMDWTWKVVLSWKPIGVLHIPKENSQQNKKVEEKRW